MEDIVLDNGLRVLLRSMLNTHSVVVGLYIKAGVGYNEPKNGITHFLEHLHFRQLGDTTQDDLYYWMESIGSTLKATTYKNLLMFTMKVAPCYLEQCLEIFSKIIEASQWTEINFNKEKQVVINQILEKGNYVSIDREVSKNVFKGHPLALTIMGREEDVDEINLDDIIKYKEDVFSASNLLFCISGDFSCSDRQNVLGYLEKCIISKVAVERQMLQPSCFHKRKPDVSFVRVLDDNPLEVCISFDVVYGSYEEDVLKLLNCVLGEGVGSRLQKQIREEKCYSSNIASYIERYEGFAVFHITLSVEKRRFMQCLEEIVKVLSDIKYNIGSKDLEISLPFYTTNQVFIEDDTEEMNYQLAYHQLIYGRTYEPMTLQNNRTTILKLQSAAKVLFISDNACLTVVGNTTGITKKSISLVLEKLNNPGGLGAGSAIP